MAVLRMIVDLEVEEDWISDGDSREAAIEIVGMRGFTRDRARAAVEAKPLALAVVAEVATDPITVKVVVPMSRALLEQADLDEATLGRMVLREARKLLELNDGDDAEARQRSGC